MLKNRIFYNPYTSKDKEITIGRRTDHNAEIIVFTGLGEMPGIKHYLKLLYANGSFTSIPLIGNKGNEFPVTATYTDKEESYDAQVVSTVDGQVVKNTPIFKLRILKSIPWTSESKEEVPPGFKFAYDEMLKVTEEAGQKIKEAVSPIAKVEEIPTGVEITITDYKGTTVAQVRDGKDSVTVDPALSLTSQNPVENKVITKEVNLKENFATIKETEPIAEIVSEKTFLNYFYNLRESNSRKFQFRIVPNGIHQNIIEAIGIPKNVTFDYNNEAYLFVDIPYSETDFFTINLTFQDKFDGKVFKRIMFRKDEQYWNDTGWHEFKEDILIVSVQEDGSNWAADTDGTMIGYFLRNGGMAIAYRTVGSIVYAYHFSYSGADGVPAFTRYYIENGKIYSETLSINNMARVKITTKEANKILNVTIEDDGFGGYVADYNDNDINNFRNAGGIVQAKYDSGTQTFTYYYSTMESDRRPTFIRTYIEDGEAKQVLATVGFDKKVTVERRVADKTVVDAELSDTSENPVQNKVVKSAIDLKADVTYVNDNFANAVKTHKRGNPVDVYDASGVTVNVESPNIANPYKAKGRIDGQTVAFDDSLYVATWTGNQYFIVPCNANKGESIAFSVVSSSFDHWTVKYLDGSESISKGNNEHILLEKDCTEIHIYKTNPETIETTTYSAIMATRGTYIYSEMFLPYKFNYAEAFPESSLVAEIDGENYYYDVKGVTVPAIPEDNIIGTVDGIKSGKAMNFALSLIDPNYSVELDVIYNADINEQFDSKADKTYVDDTFAPVVKVDKQGTVISIDDISDMPQIMPTKVESANLFDVSKLETFADLVNNGDGTFTVTINDGQSGSNSMKLRQLIPTAKVGDTIFLNGDNNITRKAIYLTTASVAWEFNHSKTITEDMLNSTVYWYGDKLGDVVTFSNVIFNRGTEPLSYTPYVADLTQAEVSVMGNSLLPFEKKYDANDSSRVDFDSISYPYIKNLKDIWLSYDLFLGTDDSRTNPRGYLEVQYTDGTRDFLNKKYLEKGIKEKIVLHIAAKKEISSLVVRLSDYGSLGNNPNGFAENIIASTVNCGYEPYKTPVAYPVLADGTVNGVQSISPNMTILSDDGLLISTQYKADTKKYIDNKFKELAQANADTQALALIR